MSAVQQQFFLLGCVSLLWTVLVCEQQLPGAGQLHTDSDSGATSPSVISTMGTEVPPRATHQPRAVSCGGAGDVFLFYLLYFNQVSPSNSSVYPTLV